MAPEAIFGEQAEHRDAAEDDADEGEDEDRLLQRQRLERQLAEDRTGFGRGMRDHKGSRLVQDIGRAAEAGRAVRSGSAGPGSLPGPVETRLWSEWVRTWRFRCCAPQAQTN